MDLVPKEKALLPGQGMVLLVQSDRLSLKGQPAAGMTCGRLWAIKAHRTSSTAEDCVYFITKKVLDRPIRKRQGSAESAPSTRTTKHERL